MTVSEAAPTAFHLIALQPDGEMLVAAQAIRLTRRICAAPALARYRPEEYKPGAEVDGGGLSHRPFPQTLLVILGTSPRLSG